MAYLVYSDPEPRFQSSAPIPIYISNRDVVVAIVCLIVVCNWDFMKMMKEFVKNALPTPWSEHYVVIHWIANLSKLTCNYYSGRSGIYIQFLSTKRLLKTLCQGVKK